MTPRNLSNNKRIAKNTLILYLRMILLVIVSLYTRRVVLVALGVEDFGIYNVVAGVVTFLGFLNTALSNASSRFITVAIGKGNEGNSQKVFSTILLVNFLLSLIVFLASETIGLWFLLEKMVIPESRMTAALWVYQISILTIILNFISVPYNATIIAHERMKAFAYISLFDAFGKLAIAYLVTCNVCVDSLILYALLLFLIQVIDRVIYGQYCLRHFNESKFKYVWDSKQIREILSFISWSSYGSLVSVGFTHGLNILLNLFFGPAINAARGVAVQVQQTIYNFTVNFQTAINPQITKNFAQSNFKETRSLFVASSRYSFYLLCVLGLPVVGNADFILNLWLKNVPSHTVEFVQIMILIGIFQSLANPIRIVNQAEGNIRKFQIYECSYLLMILPISYIALKMGYHAESVFIVQLIIEITAQFIRIHIVLPKISMTKFDYMKSVYSRVLSVLAIGLCACFITKFFENGILNIIFNMLCIEISLVLAILIFGISSTERKFILTKIEKYINI